MIRTIPLAAAFAAALVVTGAAGASAHSNEARQIEQRLAIEKGRQTGALTWTEGRKLRKEQAEIMRVESALKADGRLSARDKRILHRLQDNAEGHIVAEKTDRLRRWRFLPRVGN